MEHKKWRRKAVGDKRALPHYQLHELTSHFLENVDRKEGRQRDQIALAWPQIVGPAVAAKSKLTAFKENTLHVLVSHSTVLSVLNGPEKARLLRILQKRFPKISIRDISFRIG